MQKLLLFLIIPLTILSQENNSVNSHIDLKTINIYSSYIDISGQESGKNITIINSSDIQNYSFNSIDELLKLIPSIELQSRGGFGTQSDVVLRGTTFNQTLVLLDGLRVNDPLTGHFSMYIPISVFEIHQIEIIRGGSSSIYGPDAVGGVINIITKSFKENYNKNEAIVESKVGGHKLKGLDFYMSKNLSKKLFSTIATNVIKSEGQELYDDIFSFFDNQNISISHRYSVNNKLHVMLRSAYSKNYFNSQYYYTRSTYDLSNELIEKTWTQLRLNYKIDINTKIDFHSSYQSVSDLYVFNPSFPVYKNHTKLFNSKLNYVKKTDQYRYVSGIELQSRGITSIDRGNHTDYYIGSYINILKKVGKLALNPSLRIDYNPSYKIQLCPQFDINYNKTNYNLRLSTGRTIRSADFTERFYNNNYLDTLSPGRNIGNPNLDAETSYNFEIGVDYKKYKNIILKNTLFYRKSTNLIDWVLLNSNEISTEIDLFENENYVIAQNISELNTLGLESEIWFNLLNDSELNINGSLGYVKIFSAENSKDFFNNEYRLSSKYLANNSGDRLNYNLLMSWKKFNLNINGRFKLRNSESDLIIDQDLNRSYFVHNLNINYKFNQTLSFNFELLNIMNKNYSDILGAIMPKRWGIVGFKYRFI
jgi:vitamin B12 transporter